MDTRSEKIEKRKTADPVISRERKAHISPYLTLRGLTDPLTKMARATVQQLTPEKPAGETCWRNLLEKRARSIFDDSFTLSALFELQKDPRDPQGPGPKGSLGIILESFWDHFGIILESFWDHYGIILGFLSINFCSVRNF